MLDVGGVEVVTDNIRTPDTDNPKGYYEFEKVKTIKRDTTWLPATRGRAFKMVSQLLYDLPVGETYRIIFMERDLEEVLRSQEKMLLRLGRTPGPREQIRRAYEVHLERISEWLGRQRSMTVLRVNYHDLLQRPSEQAERVGEFLRRKLDVANMVTTVDTSLYRNRKTASD
jgi:hypothetical protein